MTPLTEAIRNAPFAAISPEEAATMARMVAEAPEVVAEFLDDDAETHEGCDNWIKAGVIRNLAKRVRATAR